MTRPLRIAMIGQRGVPATFGGIEHHVEQLGTRLAAAGHEVTVFCRPNYATARMKTYRGMRLRYVPTVGSKHLDALLHSLLSVLVVLVGRYDVAHFHALGPGLFTFLPRLLCRAKVVQTIHGLDNERAKWGLVARTILGTAGWMSGRVPDAVIVVSRALQEYYRRIRRRDTTYIPNGVGEPTVRPPAIIRERFGLRGGDYVLFVGRLVPEKAPDELIEAFRKVDGDAKLVIAGGSSFTDDYVGHLQQLAAADERVILAGYVYGELLQELYSNAGVFVLPSHLEGLPLTLLEAASFGVPVVASSIPPHREVLGAAGPGRRLFIPGDIGGMAEEVTAALQGGPEEREGAERLRREVIDGYDWDGAADRTLALYRSLLRWSPRVAIERPELRA